MGAGDLNNQNENIVFSSSAKAGGSGGFRKLLIIFLLFIILMIAVAAVYVFFFHEAREANIDSQNQEILDVSGSQSDTDNSARTSESADLIHESETAEYLRDVESVMTAVKEYFENYGVLPDTDANAQEYSFPEEWTCIGYAPQCFDLRKAGRENGTTIVPDFLPDTPVAKDFGHIQDSGYELMFDPLDQTLVVRAKFDNEISSSGNFPL